MRDSALYLFQDPDEGRAPSSTSIQRLAAHGVPLAAIVSPWCLRAARVTFEPDEPLYQPSPLGSPAFIFAIIGEDGIVDAAAWEPRTGRIASRLGIGGMLGEIQIGQEGMGTTSMPLAVWRSPIGWLAAGRRGVAIVDPLLAAHRLSGLVLAAEDRAHLAQLRAQLVVPPPDITLMPAEVRDHAVAA